MSKRPLKTLGTSKDAHGLTRLERLVAEAFFLAGNATEAHQIASPKSTMKTSGNEGPKIIARPHVKAYLETRWADIGMSAAEAVAHLTEIARGVPSSCRNDDGTINIAKLKEYGLAGLISGVTVTKHGVNVRVESRMGALTLLLEVAGKIQPDQTWKALEAIAHAIRGED